MGTVLFNNEDGNPCTSLSDEQQRWRRHFSTVLNVQSQFEREELEKVRQRPLRLDLALKPSMGELTTALGKLKSGKAAGSSNILPEMIKTACGSEEFRALLLNLTHTVWEERQVPREWADAILVPIPKKGNLRNCDNWRGIALLDVVGKVVARILQERLQQVAEEELPESQCGFRKGRGCADMFFTIRQFVEKAIEHRTKQFFLFIDLKKAYDSVPRTAMWYALEKLGIPDCIIDIIRSFHEGMKAQIRVGGETLEEISVENGLRQGCTMAPVLFNLYACLVVERWSARVEEEEGAGTYLKYKLDHQLFRRSTRNAEGCRLNECQFADDAAQLATTRTGVEQALALYIEVATAFGLTVSLPKTKLLVTGYDVQEEDRAPIHLEHGSIDCVEEFSYLGTIVASNGRIDTEIDRRIANASKAFGALRRAVFKDRNLTINTKRLVYQACVLSVLLYGAGCWTPLRRHLKRLNAFHHRCIRTILGITSSQQWEMRITSASTREQWGDMETIATKVAKRRMEWLGHLARMSDARLPKRVLFGWLPKTRPACGPRRRWRDVVRHDLKLLDVPEKDWYDAACHRSDWRHTYSRLVADQHQWQLRPTSPQGLAQCQECERVFRREADRARHKCTAERLKPICEQRGAVQCTRCHRWFRSKGGLTVHRCHFTPSSNSNTARRPRNETRREDRPAIQQAPSQPPRRVQCQQCERWFSRPGDRARHKCIAERSKPVQEQRGSVQCMRCKNWFLSRGGLAVHKCKDNSADVT